MPEMKFRIRKSAGGYDGIISMPFAVPGGVPEAPGATGVKVTAKGATKKEALAKAGEVADKVLNNPVVSALMPPQAKLALNAAKFIAKSGIGKAALKYSGPAMRRLSKLFG